jgi:uncharacterized NAD(P)/FAD-binding protein YdhS
MPKRLVIVGGGFSGTVLAANLLRRAPARCTEIVLIERKPEIGRGLAYAVHDHPYLLNVPAGRLSADSRDPLQFLHFAQRTRPEAVAEEFLPRHLYGAYLQEFLAQAERTSPGIAFTRVSGEALRISRPDPASGGVRPAALMVEIAGREPLAAQWVILAPGNPPPAALPCTAALAGHPAYHDHPWQPLPRLGAGQRVLIIGNGLTMADVASALCQNAPLAPRVMTVSRRGLVPLPQSTFHAAAVRGDGAGLLACAGSIRRLLVASRGMAREVAEHGGDWREVVTFIRNLAPALWQQMPEAERRRFLRHLQGHWDVHRHRLPPQLAQRIEMLRRDGHLSINAGRIDRVVADGERLQVAWHRRGSATLSTVTVDALINAMGPNYRLEDSRDPLMQSLRTDGWIVADALHLGLRTGPYGGCIGADGVASGQLFYLGPMLRASHWESTAAAELRNHAENLAQYLAESAA